MEIKKQAIDIIDYIMIITLCVTQIGMLLYFIGDVFDLTDRHNKIERAFMTTYGLLLVNFFFLCIMKMTLLVERKPKLEKHTA